MGTVPLKNSPAEKRDQQKSRGTTYGGLNSKASVVREKKAILQGEGHIPTSRERKGPKGEIRPFAERKVLKPHSSRGPPAEEGE